MTDKKQNFWTLSTKEALKETTASESGLSKDEAAKRLLSHGPNSLKSNRKNSILILLLSQFKSPVIIILLFATVLSFFVGDTTSAAIILTIVLVSGLLGFSQEYGANNAVRKLLAMVQIRAEVLRGGKSFEIPVEEVVPGDIVIMNAGDVVPGDCLLLESNTLFADEATLTGETFPVEKEPCVLPSDTPLAQRKNSLWTGTHVISGCGKALIMKTGKETEFGKISESLQKRPPETEFERGVRRFGFLLMEVTSILVLAIFAINVFLKRPPLDSFLFSLALAVGLTPQLLPAIISINLAHGAKMMVKIKVIVKRLASIENFGSMNVLCSDKTGTLTEGVVKIHSMEGFEGNISEKVRLYTYLNAYFESGFINPIDQAIRDSGTVKIAGYSKLAEEPYDFTRKRLSILLSYPEKSRPDGIRKIVITKGALNNVLSVCSKAERSDGGIVDLSVLKDCIEKKYKDFGDEGYRTLGIAYKFIDAANLREKEHETDMIFLGFVTFFDPLKTDIKKTIDNLKNLGVDLKIITGDNGRVTANVMRQLEMADSRILTGPEIQKMSSEALMNIAPGVSAFAEIEPNQKERIILTLKKAGFTVGYMGDGINDATALHAADAGISVDSAADAAKEAADIVLLEKDLGVLAEGIKAGRMTFANTLKYVFMATSANFGNMFSMAGASLFLPFLPLLPKQVLLTNLMTDLPEMAIASDSVDKELTVVPRKWDIRFIRKFMITFGLISSIFDYLTFGLLYFLAHATDAQFRTGWFMESVISASVIVLVVRTRKPFFKSPPGKLLLIATLAIVAAAFVLPYTPLAAPLGFEPLPAWIPGLIVAIVALYILAAEIAKKIFYKIVKY